MFDAIDYMQQLQKQLKLTKDKYLFTTVSGVSALEGVLENNRRNDYFFAVDDSQDGYTFRGASGTFYDRRPFTVFVLGKADYGDFAKRQEVLEEAKIIYRHLLSRMNKDRHQIPVLDMERIRFYEVPPAFAGGCSGLYFIFNVAEPKDLIFDAAAWNI